MVALAVNLQRICVKCSQSWLGWQQRGLPCLESDVMLQGT